jgi:hypothetical protein
MLQKKDWLLKIDLCANFQFGIELLKKKQRKAGWKQ